MLRRTQYALLALIALNAAAHAQDPVYGLSPAKSEATADTTSADAAALDAAAPDAPAPPAEALPRPGELVPALEETPAIPAAFSGGYGPQQDFGPAFGASHGNAYAGDCSSCGDCCDMCSDCFCGGCPPTMWRVRSRGVYMDRETTDDTQIVLQNVAFAGGMLADSDTLIGGNQFDFEWETGFDVSLLRGDGYGGEYEIRFLFLNEQDDTVRGTGNNVELNNRILFKGIDPAVTGFPATLNPRTDPVNVTAHYESEFRTVELSYREPFTPWWAMMIGFRYGDLNEALNVRTADSAADPLRSTTIYLTDNDMYGLQLGTEVIIASNPYGWELRGTAKAGVYYNRVDLAVFSLGDGFATGKGNNITGETGWLGEFGLQARYNFSCSGAFTFGYQLISIDGVALATEQPTTVLNPLQGPDLDMSSNRGTVFYHGANAGVELRW